MPTDLYKPALDTQPSSLTPSLIMADNKSKAVTTHSFSHAVNGLGCPLTSQVCSYYSSQPNQPWTEKQ